VAVDVLTLSRGHKLITCNDVLGGILHPTCPTSPDLQYVASPALAISSPMYTAIGHQKVAAENPAARMELAMAVGRSGLPDQIFLKLLIRSTRPTYHFFELGRKPT